MEYMKRLALFLSCSATLAFGTDLANVKNVYLLKMSKGLDQYLANRLTHERVFQIVTDPKLADAILTEQIGEGFEAKMDELFPPPEPPAKAEKKDAEEQQSAAAILGDTVNKLTNPPSTLSRARGTVFLVDAKSKEVVWSTYEVPKDSSSRD